jgi:transposase
MAQAMTLVGLDVHARQTHAAVLVRGTGEVRGSRLRVVPEEVVEFLAGLPAPVLAVYEAGPTGFGLARAAQEHRIDVRVVAPGSIPKAPGDRVKTDKRDALRLVRLLAAGELRFVFVPTVADEAFRDLVRCIEDLRGDLMRARHRLSKFLLRRGHRYQDGHAWTPKHARWLRSLSFEEVAQATFADYCASVELLASRRATLLKRLEETVPGCSHAPTVARLRCFRGIDTLTAAGLCAELGGFHRFPRPTMLSGVRRDRPLRAHQRHQTPPRIDHQGRAAARPAAAGRGRPALPQTTEDHPGHRVAPDRPGPARNRDRVARSTAAAAALAAPARPTRQARRRGRDRHRPRTRLFPLGGRHP